MIMDFSAAASHLGFGLRQLRKMSMVLSQRSSTRSYSLGKSLLRIEDLSRLETKQRETGSEGSVREKLRANIATYR